MDAIPTQLLLTQTGGHKEHFALAVVTLLAVVVVDAFSCLVRLGCHGAQRGFSTKEDGDLARPLY